ncbi:MAG: SipW-dependent-type signal peptide-containing protein, partial [Halobacterium sp.]
MKEKQFDLTRRRVLGGLGTIGIASAAAGLGTSAYFSDTETYTGNTLTAGSLDLKVDWEEHYSDWSDDEMVMIEDGNGGSMDGVRMSKPSDPANWIGMPDPANPLLYVHSNALQEFMTRTALEAYPDDGDNGTQSLHRYGENQYCDILADAPDDLDPNRSNPARTLNDDTYDSETDTVKPLVSLDDVKPGDFGELTLSFHLCDNPGYIWMQGELVNASENGHTEPEAEDPDEEGGPNTSNSTGNDVEILDAIQTLAWYDEDLDNVYEPAGETGKEVDVVLVL